MHSKQLLGAASVFLSSWLSRGTKDKIRVTGLWVYSMRCATYNGSGMAELQGFFLFCRDDVQQALEMAKAWREADEQVVQELQLKQQQEQQRELERKLQEEQHQALSEVTESQRQKGQSSPDSNKKQGKQPAQDSE